jgi:hypothetical protein
LSTQTEEPTPELPVAFDILNTDGTISVIGLEDSLNVAVTAADISQFDQAFADILADLQETQPADVVSAWQSAVSPLKSAVDSGELSPGEVNSFLRWLGFNKGLTSLVNDTTTSATMSGYIVAYATEQGLIAPAPTQPPPTTTAPPPATGTGTITPTQPPAAGTTAVEPIATAPAAPIVPVPQPTPALPTPTPGQTQTSTAMASVTSSTVTGGTDEGTSAAQVSAALAVTAVNVLEVVAKVFDAFLPGMAPGQVPQALGQLNQALHVTEDQLATLRATTTGHATGSLSGQITALQGVVASIQAAIAQLQSQMAEKAPSALETSVNDNTTAIAALAGTVGVLAGTTIPALTSHINSVATDLGTLDNTVTNTIEPDLTQVKADTDANTKELSGTDQDCLDQLCDAESNVINPITEGGATPSLLGKLGGLLGALFGAGAIATAIEALETLLDAPAVVTAVVQDTETMSLWATQAAAVIEADFSWSGGLDVNVPAAS